MASDCVEPMAKTQADIAAVFQVRGDKLVCQCGRCGTEIIVSAGRAAQCMRDLEHPECSLCDPQQSVPRAWFLTPRQRAKLHVTTS
jgi:NAD-dependent SIR2 family protein deacetylase